MHKRHTQFSRKMCQSAKSSFEIIFIKFCYLEDILKSGLPHWFYKNHFHFQNHFFQFLHFSIKSNKYQIITKTHKKLSI